MVFLVESIEVGDLVLWVGDARAAAVDQFSCVLIVTGRMPSSTRDSQMIKRLNCCNAESPHLSNRAVSCHNARMNQAHCAQAATVLLEPRGRPVVVRSSLGACQSTDPADPANATGGSHVTHRLHDRDRPPPGGGVR